MTSTMRVVILYNRPTPADHPNYESSQDVMAQVQTVESALATTFAATSRVEMRGHLSTEIGELCRAQPDIVFNLVESVNEDPLLYPNVAGMLEMLHIPFTGSGSFALMTSTDKNLSKLIFRGAQLPTPDWKPYNGEPDFSCDDIPPPWLVKPNFEDASIGIDDSSIYEDAQRLQADLPVLREKHSKQTLLVERYVEGREFNLSLLQIRSGLEVLPIAEIDFSSFPENKPRIVGYPAKWNTDDFEYKHTPRVFHREDKDPLLQLLKSLAIKACNALGVRHYARVDFRVSRDGTPWILEVNANPCLSHDAGFMPAAEEAGFTTDQTIALILAAAIKK